MAEKTRIVRSGDFVSRYSNNVQFDLSALDMRIVFGELRPGHPLEQHTSIVMTYAQAKVMAYFLSTNVAVYEAIEGRIKVPGDTLPGPPPVPTGEDAENDRLKKAYEASQRIYEEFKDRW